MNAVDMVKAMEMARDTEREAKWISVMEKAVVLEIWMGKGGDGGLITLLVKDGGKQKFNHSF